MHESVFKDKQIAEIDFRRKKDFIVMEAICVEKLLLTGLRVSDPGCVKTISHRIISGHSLEYLLGAKEHKVASREWLK